LTVYLKDIKKWIYYLIAELRGWRKARGCENRDQNEIKWII